MEERTFAAGAADGLVVANLRLRASGGGGPRSVRTGAIICYDVEFPEAARALYLDGAQLLLVPTALTNVARNTAIPTRVVPARAAENCVYLACACPPPPTEARPLLR